MSRKEVAGASERPLSEINEAEAAPSAGGKAAPAATELCSSARPEIAELPAKRGVDLTQGHLLRGIVRLSWPIVSGAVLNWLLGVADIKMVGCLGPDAIAAVGQSMSIIFTVQFIVMAAATGTQVLIAQATGARRPDRTEAVARQSILMSFLLGAPMIPLGMLVARPLLELLGAREAVLEQSLTYTHIMFWGSIWMMLNFLCSAALQGAGDTLTPLWMLLWINVAHIIVEYLLIFGVGPFPRLGVAGAAWAVIITRGVAAIVLLGLIFSGRLAIHVPWRRSWRLSWPIWGEMFYIGMPSSIQGLVRNVGYAALIAILNRTLAGKYAVAGHVAAGQWNALGVFVGLSMMTAAMTAVGQNMGAQNPARAARSGWTIAGFSVLSALAVALPCIIFARPLVGFFTDDPQALHWGQMALTYIALALPLSTASMAFSGALRGAGDTMSPLWATILGTLCLSPLLGWLLALHFSFGPPGVWIGMFFGMLAQVAYTGFVFKAGRWKQIRI